MTTRIASLMLPAAAVTAALMLISIPAPGQAPAQGKGKGKGGPAAPQGEVIHKPIPRTADGKPDLTGTWQGGGVSINGEAGAPPLHPLPPIDAHEIRREPASYKPEWQAKRQTLNAALDDPTLACLLPGVPRITSMPMPMEIVQTPKEVVILYEAFRAWRRIPINDKLAHPDDLTPTWMGDSVGRWEGNTFVVDVTGFNDKSWIGGTGIHSEKLHVVEKYTLNDDGSLTWQFMTEDSEALTKPSYGGAMLRAPIDVHVEEYECIENNPDPDHMKKAAALATKGK
jgi:hypothetical protein